MSEWTLVWLAPLRLLIILIFSLLYTIGGRKYKAVRRFAGGLFLAASIIGLSLLLGSFKWWLLPILAAYPICLSLGYGGDTIPEKIMKRTVYGFFFGLTGFYIGMIMGNVVLGMFQFGLSIVGSVLLGVINPTEAANEEFLIALLLTVFVPFMV